MQYIRNFNYISNWKQYYPRLTIGNEHIAL